MAATKAPRLAPRLRVVRGVLLAAAILGAIASIAFAAEAQCDASRAGDPACADTLSVPDELVSPQGAESDTQRYTWEDDDGVDLNGDNATGNNSSRNGTMRVREELGAARVGIILFFLFAVLFWIGCTIKWACDGSLPARLALWGLLPEAYAAISVRAVIGLLRMKTNETPVIVLRNCVTDAGLEELDEALQKYGQKADVQSLEFPHNPGISAVGVQHLAVMAQRPGSTLQEFDLSYNPQLGDAGLAHLLPMLKPKASKMNTLRLGDCDLTRTFVKSIGQLAERSTLRLLDLSYNSLAGAGEDLATLCGAPILDELILACCYLSVDDVKQIAEELPYSNMKSLQLGGNRFGNAGLLALTEHLPSCQIEELGLEANGIDTAGLSPLGTAWAKRPFARLRLNGNKLSQEEIAEFVRTLKSMNG